MHPGGVTTASYLLPFLLSIPSVVVVAQDGFSRPSGDIADFDASFNIFQGDVAQVDWLVNTTFQPTLSDVGPNLFNAQDEVALWVTSFKEQDTSQGYWQLLAPHIDSTNGGTLQWTVNLTDAEIDNHNGQFVYRLKPPVSSINAPFNNTWREVPSRGFYILKREQSSTQSPSTQATSMPATMSSGVPVSGAPTSTPSSSVSSSSSGISPGAIAGIVVGVVAVGAIALGGLWFWLRRTRSKNNSSGAAFAAGAASNGPPPYQGGNMSQAPAGTYSGYAPVAPQDSSYYKPEGAVGGYGYAPNAVHEAPAYNQTGAAELGQEGAVVYKKTGPEGAAELA